jgi:hypothetical protein
MFEALKQLISSLIVGFGTASPWVVAVLVSSMFLGQTWYRRLLERRLELRRLQAMREIIDKQLLSITTGTIGDQEQRAKGQLDAITQRLQLLERASKMPSAEFYKRLIEYLGNVEPDQLDRKVSEESQNQDQPIPK